MITSISYKKEREAFTLFTKPYYEIPIMIFVRDDFGEYHGLESLAGKRVGVLKDIFYGKDLEEIGTMELVSYETYDEITKALVFGKIDALIQNLTNINYLIKKHVYTNLKLAGELQLPNIDKEDLRFGIRPEKTHSTFDYTKGAGFYFRGRKRGIGQPMDWCDKGQQSRPYKLHPKRGCLSDRKKKHHHVRQSRLGALWKN